MKGKKAKKIKAEKLDQAKLAMDTEELAPVTEEAAAETPAPEAAKKSETAKKGGRPPMTAAEKAAAAKARKEAKALEASMVPTLKLQFAGSEVDLAAVTEAAKADFKSAHKRTPLTELTIYVKPEDGKAYYVANGFTEGIVEL
ncbi:MAG: hypothetical protein E7425_07440 [Ruminococcaceae bacterium]|nr:hypothetical protein [Oscillospiraceae bacterium]